MDIIKEKDEDERGFYSITSNEIAEEILKII